MSWWNFTPPEIKKPSNRTFFFGYGSLMYPEGINGRGMIHRYGWEDLSIARLKGFERSLCAHANRVLYYGLRKEKNTLINGTVFEVFDDYDYTRLMISEGAHPAFGQSMVYKSVDVTDKIFNFDILEDMKVFAVIPIYPTDKGIIPVHYVADVWFGIEKWGKDFQNEFARTGGRRYDRSIIEAYIMSLRNEETFNPKGRKINKFV
jgi:hypothetical protein